jgi:hypothetical protein
VTDEPDWHAIADARTTEIVRLSGALDARLDDRNYWRDRCADAENVIAAYQLGARGGDALAAEYHRVHNKIETP